MYTHTGWPFETKTFVHRELITWYEVFYLLKVALKSLSGAT